jgi:hypothetical protein
MSEPSTGDKVAMLQQEYIRYALLSDEVFNDVTVISEDEGNFETAMDKALGIITVKEEKKGVFALVRQPNGFDNSPGVRAPSLDNEFDILFVEWRDVNRNTDKGGTGKRAWSLARRALRVLKAHRAPGLLHGLTVRNPAIARTGFVRDVNFGAGAVEVPMVSYTVRLSCKEADTDEDAKLPPVTITADPVLTAGNVQIGVVGATVTLTQADADTIYYTTDLSNPCSQNTAATLYDGTPFAISTACTLLVRAFTTGVIGSDASAAKFT